MIPEPYAPYAAAIRRILTHCGNLLAREEVAILCDASTRDLGEAFAVEATALKAIVQPVEIPLASQHGVEPPETAQQAMCGCKLIVSLARFSLAHTQARLAAARGGARFLSLPSYSWPLLLDPALQCDFRAQAGTVWRWAEAFTRGSTARITSHAGTDLALDLRGRSGNACPGFVTAAGELGSPPDIEANVAPVETASAGRLVVDGSVTCPEIGLLQTSLELSVHAGRVCSIRGANRNNAAFLEELLGPAGSPRRVVAECGVGLNPLARLTGAMLTDEGAWGSVHIGLGSNSTIGGVNCADFHLDFVIRNPTLSIDGKECLPNGSTAL